MARAGVEENSPLSHRCAEGNGFPGGEMAKCLKIGEKCASFWAGAVLLLVFGQLEGFVLSQPNLQAPSFARPHRGSGERMERRAEGNDGQREKSSS